MRIGARRVLTAALLALGLVTTAVPILGVAPATASAARAEGLSASQQPAKDRRPNVGKPVPSHAAGNCIDLGATRSHGARAVQRLGRNLDRVARRADRSGAGLAGELRRDPSLWIDRCSHPFFADPSTSGSAAGPTAPVAKETVPTTKATAAPTVTASLVVPVGDTFRLHSRPDAPRVIYLDFDGHALQGTEWAATFNGGQGWTVPAYDIDGNPTNFNSTERNAIQSVWERVSEDFAPLDVDVTTEDPGWDALDRASASDTHFGMRAVVTGDTVIGGTCGCKGVAYDGAFDLVRGARFQPTLIFTAGTGTTAKKIAEATTHQLGHTLGLSHDGTTSGCGTGGTGPCDTYKGQTSGVWAPIMGDAADNPLTQWSAGEYSGASNRENDFVTMLGHGLTAVADDVGSTATTATDLGAALPTGATGLIGSATDVDLYKFTSVGGSVTATVAPSPTSPNLDAKLTVYASNGTTVVASADPASTRSGIDVAGGLGATITTTLAAGTYYVGIDGAGAGSASGTGYSDFDSLGRYSLAISTTQGPAVASGTLPSASAGVPYTSVLRAAGGTSPYTWSVVGGSLPLGMTLSSDGALSGTPSMTVDATFTVQVTDASARTATRPLAITNAPAITSRDLPDAVTSTAYATSLPAVGGTAPYSWAITAGSLPAGLTFASTGAITGTPTTAGTNVFIARVTDGAGRTRTRELALTVDTPFVPQSYMDTFGVGEARTTEMTWNWGGRADYVFTIDSGSLPPGVVVQDVGRLTGTARVSGDYQSVLRITDRSGRTATTSLRVVVQPFDYLPTTLPNPRQGSPYTSTFTLARGGLTAPVTWTISGGALPAGLTLSTSGVLSGTPTAAGQATFDVRAADATGLVSTRSYSVTVQAPTPPPPAVPAAPNPVLTSAGVGQATVSWSVPSSDGGSPITGYRISALSWYTEIDPIDVPASETSHVVTGLQNGERYRFTVSALNANGEGAQGVGPMVWPTDGVPGPPGNVLARPGDASAVLSWLPPDNSGSSPITGYVVTPYLYPEDPSVSPSEAQEPQVFESTATSQRVVGLTNGSQYWFEVAAINAQGSGVTSYETNLVKPLAGVGQPWLTSLTPGDGQATLSWEAPVDDGGSPITGYVVSVARGTAVTTYTFDTSTTTRTITGLLNGSSYTFSVAAVTAAGTGPQSLVRSTTPAGPPLISSLSMSAANHWVRASWVVNGNGAAVTGYQFTLIVNGVPQATETVTDAHLSVNKDIYGLQNGVPYSFSVAATSTIGTGPAATSNAVTPTSPPDAPVMGTAVGLESEAVLSWTPPAFDGGSPVTGYVVTTYCNGVIQAPTKTFDASTTTRTLSAPLGTCWYTYRVAAQNAFGTSPVSAVSNPIRTGGFRLEVDIAPSVSGQTVVVTANAPTGVPSATVGFYDGPTFLGTKTRTGGIFKMTLSKLTAGDHRLQVAYYETSGAIPMLSTPLIHHVDRGQTSTTLTATPTSTVWGEAVKLKATVAVVAPAVAIPSGSVSYYDGATLLGSASLASGSATLSVKPNVGSHPITAVYSGSTELVSSASAIVDQVVDRAATTTVLTSSANPSVSGQSVAFKAKVTVVAPGTGTPAGYVDYFEGATLLASKPLSLGSATYSVVPTVGTHDITAVYRASDTHASSTATLTQTVNRANSKVTLVSSSPTAAYGAVGKITATVAVLSPGTGVPSGSLEFYDEGVLVATVTLASGKGYLQIAPLSRGVHHITAVYLGDAKVASSTTTTALTQTIT